jgi:hypothetical protein
MPKAKPTQVIVHRIELQEKERDMMEAYVAGKTVKNVVEPAVAVATAYVAYKSAKSLYDWGEDVWTDLQQRMANAREYRNNPDNKIDSIEDLENATVSPFNNPGYSEDGQPTNIFGLPGWGIWPGVL